MRSSIQIIQADLYQAQRVGMNILVTRVPAGLSIIINGFSQRVRQLIDIVFNAMTERLSISDVQYRSIVDSIIVSLSNYNQLQPYQHAYYIQSLFVQEDIPTNEQLATAVRQVSLESLTALSNHLLGRDNSHDCVTLIYAHGNIRTESVEYYIKNFMKSNNAHKQAHSQTHQHIASNASLSFLPTQIMMLVPTGTTLVRTSVLDGSNKNHAAMQTFYVTEYANVKESVLLDLIGILINQPAFNQLRTIEQLGYIVHTSVVTHFNSIRTLTVTVQSAQYTADYLNKRIQQFLITFYHQTLHNITDAQMLKQQNLFATSKQTMEQSIQQRAEHGWQAINSGDSKLERDAKEIAIVRSISVKDVANFFYRKILIHRSKRLFAVEVYAADYSRASLADDDKSTSTSRRDHVSSGVKRDGAKGNQSTVVDTEADDVVVADTVFDWDADDVDSNRLRWKDQLQVDHTGLVI